MIFFFNLKKTKKKKKKKHYRMTLSTRQKNVQFPQKLDFWTIIVGIPLAAIFINLLLSWHLILGGNYLDFLKSYAFSLGFTTLYWLVFRKIFFYFPYRITIGLKAI